MLATVAQEIQSYVSRGILIIAELLKCKYEVPIRRRTRLEPRTNVSPGTFGGALVPTVLDATDWRILKELMADSSITNLALAQRVGLSAPPCLRRVRVLKDAGFITGYTALVDEARLGFEVTAFALVRLHNQAEADLRAFENLVLGWPAVREAYMLAGESDYILKCVARDMTAFQDFVLNELTAAPNVASVKTQLAIRRAKLAPGVPVPG